MSDKTIGTNLVINENYEILYNKISSDPIEDLRYIVYYGGRGGGKSYEFAEALIILGRYRKLRILCAREVQNSIADSVHKLLKDTIWKYGFQNHFKITDKSIIGINGTQFIFKGISSDPMQIKSLEGIDICWVEEAQKVSENSWEILIPTIRKESSQIWVSFNPFLETDPTYKRFIKNTPPNTFIKKINHEDNAFFPKVLQKEMEYMRKTNYELYLHIWEGQCRNETDAQIFKGKYAVSNLDDLITKNDIPYFGMDFGFAVDPTTVVKVYILETQDYGNTLYVQYGIGQVGLEIDKTPSFTLTVPESDKFTIYGDSARPETISFLKGKGLKVEGVKKWGGSVEDGIEHIKSYDKVVIHPRAVGVIEEFKLYSYKIDKRTDDILPIVIDANNHYVDAIRYALSKVIQSKMYNYRNLL